MELTLIWWKYNVWKKWNLNGHKKNKHKQSWKKLLYIDIKMVNINIVSNIIYWGLDNVSIGWMAGGISYG